MGEQRKSYESKLENEKKSNDFFQKKRINRFFSLKNRITALSNQLKTKEVNTEEEKENNNADDVTNHDTIISLKQKFLDLEGILSMEMKSKEFLYKKIRELEVEQGIDKNEDLPTSYKLTKNVTENLADQLTEKEKYIRELEIKNKESESLLTSLQLKYDQEKTDLKAQFHKARKERVKILKKFQKVKLTKSQAKQDKKIVTGVTEPRKECDNNMEISECAQSCSSKQGNNDEVSNQIVVDDPEF